MTHYIAVLTIKDGKREEYIGELKHANLVEQFREQHGNVHYFISKSVDDPDVVIVSDLWETWTELYDQYVLSEKSNLYEK